MFKNLFVVFALIVIAGSVQAADKYINAGGKLECYKVSDDGLRVIGVPVERSKCAYAIYGDKCYAIDTDLKPWGRPVNINLFCSAQ